ADTRTRPGARSTDQSTSCASSSSRRSSKRLMDGLLIVDKPSGPTSHDIVACVRRVLRERRVGHTGTLDPMASGVLPIVVGRATRLARFVGGDKAYVASIRLGISTDSYDALGKPAGEPSAGPWPPASVVESALERFRGTFDQQPPAFS